MAYDCRNDPVSAMAPIVIHPPLLHRGGSLRADRPRLPIGRPGRDPGRRAQGHEQRRAGPLIDPVSMGKYGYERLS